MGWPASTSSSDRVAVAGCLRLCGVSHVANQTKPQSKCELCGRRPGLRCCDSHDVVVCERCYRIVTERFLVPSVSAAFHAVIPKPIKWARG